MNELFDQRKWEQEHRLADQIIFMKDGVAVAAIDFSPQGRARGENAQIIVMLQNWANAISDRPTHPETNP